MIGAEYGGFRPRNLEPVLKEHMDIIDTFSWSTEDYLNVKDYKNSELKTRDLARTGE